MRAQPACLEQPDHLLAGVVADFAGLVGDMQQLDQGIWRRIVPGG